MPHDSVQPSFGGGVFLLFHKNGAALHSKKKKNKVSFPNIHLVYAPWATDWKKNGYEP